MAAIEDFRTSGNSVFRAASVAMVNSATTVTITSAQFTLGVSRILGVTYDSGSAAYAILNTAIQAASGAAKAALISADAPYIVSVVPAALSTTKQVVVTINLPRASAATWDGAIFSLYWTNDSAPDGVIPSLLPC
jgi:hypothetical protein